jgi:tRNA pseudouridine38-40 synthase
MGRYRLDLAYDGSPFHGFARQPALRTVQGDLEEAIAKVVEPVRTECAGRTDAGVHARHQVVTFETDEAIDTKRLARSLTKLLAPEVVVYRCEEVADDFSARFSAVRRRYKYRVLNRPFPDPLRRFSSWHVPEPLDVDAMNAACELMVGTHDFASFCRPAEGRTTVREVLSASWGSQFDDLVVFDVSATAFCHQMVRSLVAFTVEVGRGRLEAAVTAEVLAAADRNAARGAAPPCGLVLWEVCY